MKKLLVFVVFTWSILDLVLSGRPYPSTLNQHHHYSDYSHVASASQQVPQQVMGYHYPIPTMQLVAASINQPQTKPAPATTASSTTTSETTAASTSHRMPMPTAAAAGTTVQSKPALVSTKLQHSSTMPKVTVTLQTAPAAATADATNHHTEHLKPDADESVVVVDDASADTHHPLRTPMIEGIDVACGKERMTVRITFDQEFNGIVYAKGHYNDPNCRFVMPNSNNKMYQFDLTTGQCGVGFVDSGLTSGGQAFVEGLLVVIAEPGVQEAWDAARKIRCLWEGNLEQTVTFPLSVNMLEQKLLTFSGDTASVALEIQSGRGPRAATVQGLVRIGDMLTAVVTVQGDNAFDLLVRNCVATDGTPNNRIVLSDNQGCAVKPKLMGGWLKQKTSASVVAYSYLAAFKFPDVMDLFLECTVSLCKGECDECPEYLELHIPVHEPAGVVGAETEAETKILPTSKRSSIKRSSSKIKRSIDSEEYILQSSNQTIPEESLRLRRVVHVIGPDDLPEFEGTGSAVYGNCQSDCFSLLGIVLGVAVIILMIMVSLAIYGTFRRRHYMDKC